MKRSVSGFINGDIDTCAVNIDSADYQWIIVIFFCQPHPTEQGHLNTIWISNGANLYFFFILFIDPTGWNVRNCLPQQPSGGEIFRPALVSAVVDHQNRELARDIFRIR